MVDDGADDGVPQGGPAQQRLRQAGTQAVAHPAAHVSLRPRMSLSWQHATGCKSGAAMETDLGVSRVGGPAKSAQPMCIFLFTLLHEHLGRLEEPCTLMMWVIRVSWLF